MGIIKTGLIITAISTLLSIFGNWWVLPESQRERCIQAVHSWYIEEANRIENLTVGSKIKLEMVKFSQEQETKDLRRMCGVDNGHKKVSNMQR